MNDRIMQDALKRIDRLERALAQLTVPDAAQYAMGSFTWDTSTGTQAITGVGFTPRLVLFFSTGFAASATVLTHGFGTDDGTNRRSTSERVSAASQYRSKSATYSMRLLESDSTTAGVEGYVQSMDSGGFTINRVTHTGSPQPEWYYVAIG